MADPRLRNVDKTKPPYPLGCFTHKTIMKVAGGIIYLLCTRGEARLEGQDWERIFADGISAEWKPSNVGLDDVQLESACWGAKTVKTPSPAKTKKIRLISGRNSIDFSYGESDPRSLSPGIVGTQVLNIWNERVSSVRKHFKHVRTVVLLKSKDLSECAIFELETVRYEPERYSWKWNARRNLEGFATNDVHKFTWQPHGSQFTIIEDVPENRVAFRLKLPEPMDAAKVLEAIGFEETWVQIL